MTMNTKWSGGKGSAIAKGSNGDPILAVMLSWSAVIYSFISAFETEKNTQKRVTRSLDEHRGQISIL